MKKMMIELLSILMIIPAIIYAQHERTEHWNDRTKFFQRDLEKQEKGKIIFLGNSITEGFDLDNFFPEQSLINRGISGDHIDGLLERLDYSVIQLAPEKLFILIGINDIGAGAPDSLILRNYQLLMTRLSEKLPETTVYIQSILPTTDQWPNCPPEKIRRLNKHIFNLAVQHHFTWIDLYPHFATDDNSLLPRYTNDGLHLNEEGYKRWVDLIKQYIIE